MDHMGKKNIDSFYRKYIKRVLGFAIALIALICLSPLLLVVTIWLHFANKGAGAFFLQERHGVEARQRDGNFHIEIA